ncbi:SPOSA6832_04892, partial [Sporobolomyces salmonicolor]
MAPSAHRYTGPPPTCPKHLRDQAPPLSAEQLSVPTAELYSAALAEAWSRTSPSIGNGEVHNVDEEQVERLEPDPTRPDRPVPQHYGPYAKQRASLDWSYHVVPSRARQALQDEIVSLVLGTEMRECKDAGDDEPCRVASERHGIAAVGELGVDEESGDEKPLALFTAGRSEVDAAIFDDDDDSGMGAGKGHTLREMLKTRRIRLPRNTVWFVSVLFPLLLRTHAIDPDALSRLLPERPLYVAHCPSRASALLHPEASLLQEICAAVAKGQRRSLVVDGSLTDCAWFDGFMREFRKEGYECEILFVSAPENIMLQRAERRARTTGRVTNPDAIRRSRIRSPEVRLIDNSSDAPSSATAGPSVMYDSALDPVWPAAGSAPNPDVRDINKSGWVDAKGFVEGRLVQGEDGRVRGKEEEAERQRDKEREADESG